MKSPVSVYSKSTPVVSLPREDVLIQNQQRQMVDMKNKTKRIFMQYQERMALLETKVSDLTDENTALK